MGSDRFHSGTQLLPLGHWPGLAPASPARASASWLGFGTLWGRSGLFLPGPGARRSGNYLGGPPRARLRCCCLSGSLDGAEASPDLRGSALWTGGLLVPSSPYPSATC